ncbi:PmeII family type II restriction endonuclease [Kitasatospora phosalacinea]|uniref:PmeII family type II restriction endonuclease n=1 Tax=Kitasatospora phosalacinea TaxID=2065 RepID=UPI0035D9DAC0
MTSDSPLTSGTPLTEEVQEALFAEGAPTLSIDTKHLAGMVSEILRIDLQKAELIVDESERLYISRMRERFSDLKIAERLKRTNPFLLRIRGIETVREWAALQVQTALYASEEEAVGHLLESIAKICFPGARVPENPEDLDFEATGENGEIEGYQVKMSWDCMPMSSRKNLSNTIRRLKNEHESAGGEFVGYFAPCYGRATTSKSKGQDYISLASREFWMRVGGGDPDYDVRVGNVCALLCSEFRTEVLESLVPSLVAQLAVAAESQIGNGSGGIDNNRLFRRINK